MNGKETIPKIVWADTITLLDRKEVKMRRRFSRRYSSRPRRAVRRRGMAGRRGRSTRGLRIGYRW